jgi:hypothetical protein
MTFVSNPAVMLMAQISKARDSLPKAGAQLAAPLPDPAKGSLLTIGAGLGHILTEI